MFISSVFRAAVLTVIAIPFAFSQDTQSVSPPSGEKIFSQRCASCHGPRGEGVNAVITFAGPSLQAEHDSGLAMTAMEVGPSHMPSFAYVLSVEEMRAVADYVTHELAVIPITGGNLSQGGVLFREYCAPCHQTAATGGALVFTGINAPSLAGRSPAMIAGAIRSGPGPMPAFPTSVLSDQQMASIVDYVQFVEHPPSPGGNSLGWYGPVAEGFVAWVVVFIIVLSTAWIEKGGRG